MKLPRRAILAMAVLAVASPALAGERLTIGGHIKSFVVGYDPAGFKNKDEAPAQEFLWANNNRVRMNAGLLLTDWLDGDASYDLSLRIQDDNLFEANPFLVFQELSIYRVDDLKRRIWPDDPGEGDHVALYQNLDRLYLTASAPSFDLFAGRQAIAWGSAHAINPTDIFAPFLYTEIDTEDRIGVDAARLRVPAGSLGEIDAGYVAGEDFEWKQSSAYLRGKFYAAKTDFSLLLIGFRENLLAGFDVTRAVSGAGAWCEAAYVWANALNSDERVDDEKDYLRLSAGADCSFGAGVYTFLEYHYNGAGSNDPENCLANSLSNPTAYRDGAVYLLGRHYIIPGVSWQVTPLTTLFIETMANLSDGSLLFAPYIEYNASENIYLSLGGYAAIGDNPEAITLRPPVGDNGAMIPRFNSEFGAYPNQYYAFLRYYF